MSQPERRRLEVVAGGASDVGGPRGLRLIERLGDGAEGGAWRAQDDAGVDVVAKPVPRSARRAVQRAFDTLRTVGSPNLPVPRSLTVAEDGGLWLVTAWVPGSPLGPGPVAEAEAFADAAALARALAALHEAGTHHGDVSPANVVVDGEQRTLVDLAQLGRRGTGTPGFMAPEVLAGGGGAAADRFALGSLLVWRLTGEAPWTRPEALLEVRRRRDVVARLRELGLADASAFRLIVRLLLPDPAARPASTRDVARQLADLAAAPHEVVAGGLRWWAPQRWPYVGVPLEDAVQALAEGTCRLLVVAGAPGSGRDRIVEELVLRLHGMGHGAGYRDAPGWARAHGAPSGSWLEAWQTLGSDAPVTGLVMEPIGAELAPRIRAAAALAQARVVVPTDEVAGHALEGAQGIMVLWPRPLTPAEGLALVASAVDGTQAEVAALAEALREASGGWPAAMVRIGWACARRGAAAEEVPAVAAAGRVETHEMLPGLAVAVLRARWSEPDPSLPPTLAPQGRPLALACARARAALGPEAVREQARGTEPSPQGALAWAIDAEDPEALAAAMSEAAVGEPELARALAWVERADVPPAVLAAAADRRLAEGAADVAERLASRGGEHAGCTFARARALQRLGRLDEARALLEEPRVGARSWAERGLRWRIDVDRGQAAAVEQEAARLRVDDQPLDAGLAAALLWSSYAAALDGRVEAADRRLWRVVEWARPRAGREAAGLRARALQLQGNLAHAQGDLERAAQRFDEAAGSFAAAGEPVGGLTLRGTTCALSVLTLDLASGIEAGRAALRGLLAHGQTSALMEAALNLVQLLARVGAAREARAIASAVDAALSGMEGSVLGARRARLRADVQALEAGARPEPAAQRSLAAAYAAAASALEAADHAEEAVDAWSRAAWHLTLGGRAEAAAAFVDRMLALLPEDDPSARVHAGAVAVLVASRAGLEGLLNTGLAFMRGAGAYGALRQAHRLDLAVLFDRALLGAVRAFGGAPARRRALAQRLLSTVEIIMHKTRPEDRPAVRASLIADGGDTQALRELLEDLESDASAPVVEQPAADDGTRPPDGRYAKLLRMYRRFAREERLEPLLEQVVDAVMELTDAERGAVVVRRAHEGDLSVTRELSEGSEGASYSRSVIERVMGSGEPVLSVDAAADERFDDSRSISHLNLRSVLAVPLRFRGQLLGAAYVDHRLRRGNFGEDDLAHMEAFADLAALAVAHAAALRDLERKTEALTASSEQLSALLEQREAEVLALREDARRQPPSQGYRGIVGSSARMQTVFRLIDRIAGADVPVVVHGESGTGKELVARALHEAGSRAEGPFVAENCGAIPETLLESVLFGHAKGAFTGAQTAKPGLFEAADGGTMFLDEISEMSMAMQTKLLRVLQEGEIRRVGETRSRSVDVRVVAASNQDLEAMVAQGTFRRDLFYRINVVRVELPPLRERVEDIGPLIDHFFARHGSSGLKLAPSVSRALRAYAWPGNVRQLENEVQRWLALCEGAVALEDLSPAIVGVAESDPLDPDDLRIKPRVERMERELIARALEQTGNNQTQAAQLLGLSRYGLQKKLKRLEVDVHRG